MQNPLHEFHGGCFWISFKKPINILYENRVVDFGLALDFSYKILYCTFIIKKELHVPKIGMEKVRKEAVIGATMRCLCKGGFTGLSVKAIAAEAGLSTGIIYHYFKNKEDLLLNVIREAFAQSHQNVMQVVEPLTSQRDKLFKHIESIHSVVLDNPDFYTVLLNFLGQTSNNPEVKKIMTKFLSNLTSYVRRYLEEGVARKEFAPDKTKDLDVMIIALGMGLGIMCTLAPETFDHKQLGESFKSFAEKYVE